MTIGPQKAMPATSARLKAQQRQLQKQGQACSVCNQPEMRKVTYPAYRADVFIHYMVCDICGHEDWERSK